MAVSRRSRDTGGGDSAGAGAAWRRWPRLPTAALALALLVALTALMSGFGSRWGFWDQQTGLAILRWAVYGAVAVIVFSGVVAVLTRPGTSRRGFLVAVLALVIGLATVFLPVSWRRSASSAPPIHDVTTDTQNPPEFVAIAPMREDAPNPVEHGGPEVAAQQRRAYPDIRPLILDVPAERAFTRALDAAHRSGWQIVDVNPAEGRIEATARTFWFGFRDDIVIRLTPLGARTVVDVRSSSRALRGDGRNARHVREYLEEVQD